MPYASPGDLIERYDANDIAQLASDTGTPVDDVDTDPKILTALAEASGRINSACMSGQQYAAADLAALTGDDLAFLKGLTCKIAYAGLMRRRPEKNGAEAVQAIVEEAEAWLDLIRTGKNVFNIEVNKDAGLPTIDGPHMVDYDRLNLIPERTKNFYPRRRLPLGRGAD